MKIIVNGATSRNDMVFAYHYVERAIYEGIQTGSHNRKVYRLGYTLNVSVCKNEKSFTVRLWRNNDEI